MSKSNALPHPICIEREQANAIFNLSHNGSFRHLPPRKARGMVLWDDLLALLKRTARNGADTETVPTELMSIEEVCDATGFSSRRLHDWVRAKRLPCYWISNKNIMFKERDVLAAVGAKSSVEMPNRWEKK